MSKLQLDSMPVNIVTLPTCIVFSVKIKAVRLRISSFNYSIKFCVNPAKI